MNSLSYDDIFQHRSDCGEPECSFMKNLEKLRQSPVFSSTSLDTLKIFAYFFKTRYYKKNEFILKQGEQADCAFFLLEGQVKAYHNIEGNENDTFVLQKMGPLDFFGEMALLARFECFFNVIALSDVKLLSLDRKSFQKVLSKFPDRQNDIVERIVQLRIKRFEGQMSSFINRSRHAQPQLNTP